MSHDEHEDSPDATAESRAAGQVLGSPSRPVPRSRTGRSSG